MTATTSQQVAWRVLLSRTFSFYLVDLFCVLFFTGQTFPGNRKRQWQPDKKSWCYFIYPYLLETLPVFA